MHGIILIYYYLKLLICIHKPIHYHSIICVSKTVKIYLIIYICLFVQQGCTKLTKSDQNITNNNNTFSNIAELSVPNQHIRKIPEGS